MGIDSNIDNLGMWTPIAKVHVMACPPGMCHCHGGKQRNSGYQTESGKEYPEVSLSKYKDIQEKDIARIADCV